ncbi:MAG TPA: DUF6062 family protein [Gaiellales bacterium]|nr:DUF6062 family protein [Gaiellales bacterium]
MAFRPPRGTSSADLAYPVVSALARPGCAFCRHQRELDSRAAWSFLYEGRSAAETREQLAAAGGFCSRHTDLVLAAALRDDLTAGLATVYESLLAADLRRLESRSSQRRRSRQPLPAGVCPLCSRLGEAEARMASFLAARLAGDLSVREAYERSDGFCRPHLRLVADAGGGDPAAEWLLADAVTRMRRLRGLLQEYRRKRDHRFHDEPRGVEQQAPAQAARMYARRRCDDGL